MSLTLRNLGIGAYIARYELNGSDRTMYGEMLIPRLAESLETAGVSACDKRQLYNDLRFYQAYPEITEPMVGLYEDSVPADLLITASPKVRSVTTQFGPLLPDLIKTLSYAHLEQIFPIETPLKRRFYELQCIRGNWSVRELKRQIASL